MCLVFFHDAKTALADFRPRKWRWLRALTLNMLPPDQGDVAAGRDDYRPCPPLTAVVFAQTGLRNRARRWEGTENTTRIIP